MRLERRQLTLAALVIAAAAALAAGAVAWFWPKPTPAILEANGQVRGTEVLLSAKSGGVVEVVAVREGERVARGDLVAQIGAADVEARLAQARALAEAAAAQLSRIDTAIEQARLGAHVKRGTLAHGVHQAEEALARAEAEVLVAQAQQRQDRAALERFEKLARGGFVSDSYMDEVRARQRTSAARLEATVRAREEARAAAQRARAATGEAAVRDKDEPRLQAERAALAAQLEAARARAAEIEVALREARLVAPSKGTVVNRLAEPGELAAPGRAIAMLIDLENLFVRVYVAEKDLGKLRLGNPARIRVDAFPGRFFAGRVVEVAQQAEFTPKDVHMQDEREKLVFGVKVRIDNPGGHLKPGMPADVRIKWRADAAW
jgi:HlyD family secretion protein